MEVLTRYLDIPMVIHRAVDITAPSSKKEVKHVAIFYVHGGGWRGGARDGFHRHMDRYVEKGYVSASAGYRLASDNVKLRVQMLDLAQAYDTFVSYLKQRKSSINKIVVAGSSAGAHLASLLALTNPKVFNPGIKLRNTWVKPWACVSVNGPGTFEKWENMGPIQKSMGFIIGASYTRSYRRDIELFKKASPILYVNETSPGFLFILAGLEHLFPHYLIYQMAEKLRKHGKYAKSVVVKNAKHGFFYGVNTPEQKCALKVMDRFLLDIGNGKV
ncbi:MAG: alpha/beta hydrolase [Elusimicrobiota bacterium]